MRTRHGSAVSIFAACLFHWTSAATGSECGSFGAGSGYGVAQNRVTEIVDKKSITEAMKDSSPRLHVLRVINGTEFLHLGGSVSDFGLFVGKQFSSVSDLSLQEALNIHQISSVQHGVILQAWPASLSGMTIKQANTAKLSSLWNSVPRQSVSPPLTQPLNILWGGDFGLDLVFSRMRGEGILLDHDFIRIRSMADNLYLGTLEDSEVRYLKTTWRKYQRSGVVGQRNTVGITELFVESLLHLIEHFQQFGELGRLELLPDLQTPKTLDPFPVKDLDELSGWLTAGSDTCHLVSMRAGLLLLGESLNQVSAFLQKTPSVRILIQVLPYDDVSVQDLERVWETLGTDRSFLQIDLDKMNKLESERSEGQATPSIPVPAVKGASDGIALSSSMVLAATAVIYNSIIIS